MIHTQEKPERGSLRRIASPTSQPVPAQAEALRKGLDPAARARTREPRRRAPMDKAKVKQSKLIAS